MRIGELAEQVGVTAKSIRYYEGIGLLPAPDRRPSGYRDYTDDDVERLRFVKTAQRLNLSLAEISEILAFHERAEPPCEYVLGVLDRQVADLDRRIAEMAQLRDQLVALKARTDRLPQEAGCYCAVIEHAQIGRDRPSPPGGADPRRRPGRSSSGSVPAKGHPPRQ